MLFSVEEALRFLGVRGSPPASLRGSAEAMAERLTAAVTPRWTCRIFPLEKTESGFSLKGGDLCLPGGTAGKMLSDCGEAALLACTLGVSFDTMLRAEQARDMGSAVLLDACGSAFVEAACDEAEKSLAARLPGRFLTDRFSPGYGDLPLSLQKDFCAALDTQKKIGLFVTESCLLNPVKSVTAVIGISERPQMARVRGCGSCSLRETCALRKGGKSCAI